MTQILLGNFATNKMKSTPRKPSVFPAAKTEVHQASPPFSILTLAFFALPAAGLWLTRTS